MNNMRNKILMTLALLLTAVTGAWADETPLVTINASNDFKSGSKTFDNKVTATFSSDVAFSTNVRNGGWFSFSGERTLTVEPADGVTITRVKYYTTLGDAEVITAPFVASMSLKYVYVSGGSQQYCHVSVKDIMIGAEGTNNYLQKIEVYGTAEPPIEVAWDASTKTGTFTMPTYDVELTPIYAPKAMFATDGNLVLTPTAIEGIFAGTEDAIVNAGTVAQGQGSVMYFATTDAEMTAEKAAKAEGWLSTLPTAKGYDGAQTVYVWYYIKGADAPEGQTATAENTFNDTEICAEPIKVEVLSNKFDINFNAANANTIEAGKATVTVGGTAATVTEGKLEGVKMGSEVKMTAKEGYKFRKVKTEKKAPDNTYQKWDADQKKLVATEIPAEATTVANANTDVEWAAGTYVVEGEVTINGTISLNGNVELIIKDGAKLTVNKYIYGGNKNLSIYGQAKKNGQLVVNSSISDAIYNITTLEVHNCQVTATSSKNGYGGFYNIKTFNVYGGLVDVKGTVNGYGISLVYSGSMNIYGGEVRAEGSGNDASYSYGIRCSSSTNKATVTVYGGKLWAGCANKGALNNITLTKDAGYTSGKIETSSDGSSWTEYTEASTPTSKYVRVGF